MAEPGTWTSAAADGRASTRDRLLDAAVELFYRDGVHIGVEALCRAAGVSKRSMYQLFDSKDELVAESLRRGAAAFDAFMLPAADDDRPPRERILHVFRQMEVSSRNPDFQGCPYVATAVELKAPQHPASRAAREYKDSLTAFFRDELRQAGAKNPELLAKQLTIVFDGAGARAVVQGAPLDGIGVQTAQLLLDGAGIAA
ncbi:MAG: TetR/AcrR family transcriptional regulator [Actinocrinis sp.]